MIDAELKIELEKLNLNLIEIKNKKTGIWRSFFNGVFSALGYIAGLAVVLVVLGWVLNKTGLLPAFKKQISDFQGLIERVKQLTGGADDKNNAMQGQTFILPDGREVKMKPSN